MSGKLQRPNYATERTLFDIVERVLRGLTRKRSADYNRIIDDAINDDTFHPYLAEWDPEEDDLDAVFPDGYDKQQKVYVTNQGDIEPSDAAAEQVPGTDYSQWRCTKLQGPPDPKSDWAIWPRPKLEEYLLHNGKGEFEDMMKAKGFTPNDLTKRLLATPNDIELDPMMYTGDEYAPWISNYARKLISGED